MLIIFAQARTVETHKPPNMHAKIEERVFIAHCWVTHTTVERIAAPQPLSLIAMQHRGKNISVAVSRHATIAAV
jgi:hypothetical protein